MADVNPQASSNIFTVRGLVHQLISPITEPDLMISLFLPIDVFNDLGGKAQGSLHALPDALSGQYEIDRVTTEQNISTWVRDQIAEGKVTTGLPGFRFNIEVEEVGDFEEFENRSREWQDQSDFLKL